MAKARPLLGLVAGVAAGLVASALMEAFQNRAAKLLPEDGGEDSAPATEKAADRVSEAVTDAPLAPEQRQAAGRTVHYLTGAAVGGLYGVLTEYRPEASSGFGGAYGIATSLLLDEIAVPAADLGDAPEDTSFATQAYGVASHVVFGLALEGFRRLIAGRREA